jgi:hypothetical protein
MRSDRGRLLMVDEINPSSTTESVETDATAIALAPKKQRAPRRQKAVAEATAPSAETVKSPRAYRKRVSEPTGDAKAAVVEQPVVGKSKTKGAKNTAKNTAKQAKQTAKAPAAPLEEMADLVKLEEENKRLRKALADKLRVENSDLRKRLGFD